MTDNIAQATICGIAFTQCGRNYLLVGNPQPKQHDSALGSLWYAIPTLEFTILQHNQVYEHPRNVWLPVGTVIELYDRSNVFIKDCLNSE